MEFHLVYVMVFCAAIFGKMSNMIMCINMLINLCFLADALSFIVRSFVQITIVYRIITFV